MHGTVLIWKSEDNFQELVSLLPLWVLGLNLGHQVVRKAQLKKNKKLLLVFFSMFVCVCIMQMCICMGACVCFVCVYYADVRMCGCLCVHMGVLCRYAYVWMLVCVVCVLCIHAYVWVLF